MGRIITKEEFAEATQLQQFSPPRLLADGKTVVKMGEYTRETETKTMEFVRRNTTIPVPEVYNVYKDESTGFVCIVMEFVPGTRLDEAWPSLSEGDKKSVIQQLRGYFDQLRQIKGSFIGGIDGSGCDEQLFPDDSSFWGPYKDEGEFNQALVGAWSANYADDPFIRLLSQMQASIMKDHDIVMTHNDFAPRNILFDGLKVVAIVDWQRSGFYPEYWEYCKALWRPDWDSEWINEGLVEGALDQYLKEAAVILHTSYRIW